MTSVLEPASLSDESARLAAIARYQILDTPPEAPFDRVVEAAALLLGTPMAAIDIVDGDRVWTKAAVGIEAGASYPRELGLCASAILQDGPWIIENAAADPRTAGHPFVVEAGVRFYAGVNLRTADGHRIGTLCVLDFWPRRITPAQVRQLEALAAVIVDALDMRLEARATVEREAGLRRQAEELASALQASLLPPRPPSLPEMEVATRYIAGEQGLVVGGDFFDFFRLGPNDWGIVLGDVCGKGARPASLAALARWSIRAAAVHRFSPSAVLAEVNSVFSSEETGDDDRYCSAIFARLELDRCGAWLTVANCGHPRPVMVRRSGKVVARTEPAVPIGLFRAVSPHDDRVGLGPGDALVFYTDGITEARSPEGEFFGEERLSALLSSLTGAPAQEMADAVISATAGFVASPSGRLGDDVAVLVIRVPDDAGDDPAARLSAATGLPFEELDLPSYPKDTGP